VPPEEKKPPTEFENNMMDSLKWVFIGIAIFVFLLIILSVVYWLMFGGGSNNASTVPTDATANTDAVNGENTEMNGENAANAEMNYNPPPEPYQEPIEEKESSMFSSLSSMSPFSSSKEPIVEPIAEPIPVDSPVSPLATPEVIPPSPEGVVPINVIEEVKK